MQRKQRKQSDETTATATATTITTTTSGIYNEYFRHTQENISKYGEKTVVLMQVGAFFEIYGIKNTTTGEITGSKIQAVSDICDLAIADKKCNYGSSENQIIMAGFTCSMIDKYMFKLTDAGYTVPVFIQEKEGGTVTRVLDRIYSIGTYMSCETDSSPNISNNIMCIWMDTFKPFLRSSKITKDTIIIGVAVINIFTGKSYIFEYETTYYLNTTTFDELERSISVYSPCEVIFISPFSEKDANTVIQYSGIKTDTIHKLYIDAENNKTSNNDKIVNCSSQKYIKHILSNFFGEETYDVCSEFRNRVMATQAFCYLLNFVREQNPDLVRKIALPIFNNTSDRMVLANHTLSQLNLIDDYVTESKRHGKLSSVLSLLNKCCSPMGRRMFQHQLTNPTFDETWLNQEYEMTAKFIENYSDKIDVFRQGLSNIRDIEKLCRQMVIKKIYPSSIYHLYKSLSYLINLNSMLREHSSLCDYLCNDIDTSETIIDNSNQYISNTAATIQTFLQDHFILDVCQTTKSMTNFDENMIKRGVSKRLDDAVEQYESNEEIFMSIRNFFNDIMRSIEKSGSSTDFVKIHETEKSGVYLQITSRRSQNLKAYLDSYDADVIQLTPSIKFLKKDIRFSKSSGANVDIEFPLLDDTTRKLLHSKEIIQSISTEVYLEILSKFENQHLEVLENMASFISKLDVLQCKAYIAKNYNYCRPQIEAAASKSFIDARELRHCLIEHIQQNELYVTNDVCLGKENDGVLLYGTNAVGKTSLIRAIGISIIMAQSGLYVPCSTFIYKPYTAIFSRILGNDNLFKGLSTFAVEMSELRIILKMANENSLILGDELCSGTEMESALSIFVAGLVKLDEKQSSYIFATHFHEITHYDEIGSLERLKLKHMAIHYDREHDCLVYDRKLRDGSGPRIYGLEVCKSLYMDEEFLSAAFDIRNKYYPETKGELSFNSATQYNAKKIRGICEMCGEKMGEEIHHLQQQKDANKDGFIGSFHKNHAANLMSVCETCHDKIHYHDTDTSSAIEPTKKKIVRKKTTKGYTLQSIETDPDDMIPI